MYISFSLSHSTYIYRAIWRLPFWLKLITCTFEFWPSFSRTPGGDCGGWSQAAFRCSNPHCNFELPHSTSRGPSTEPDSSYVRFDSCLLFEGRGNPKTFSLGLFPTSPTFPIRCVVSFVWSKFKTHQKTSFQNKVCFVSKSLLFHFFQTQNKQHFVCSWNSLHFKF